MSSDLIRYAQPGALSRRTSRSLIRLQESAEVAQTEIEVVAAVQAAKADAVCAVAGRAMQDVALLSQMELQLAQTVPLASGRLAAIADAAALSLTGVVGDTVARLRRC